jgi:hypothetical protein
MGARYLTWFVSSFAALSPLLLAFYPLIQRFNLGFQSNNAGSVREPVVGAVFNGLFLFFEGLEFALLVGQLSRLIAAIIRHNSNLLEFEIAQTSLLKDDSLGRDELF